MRPPVVDNRIANGIACIRRDVVCFLRSGNRSVKSGMANVPQSCGPSLARG